MTDNNLGTGVFEQTWINEKCLDLLSDTLNYEQVHLLTNLNILDKKCTEMEEIALLAEVFLP